MGDEADLHDVSRELHRINVALVTLRARLGDTLDVTIEMAPSAWDWFRAKLDPTLVGDISRGMPRNEMRYAGIILRKASAITQRAE